MGGRGPRATPATPLTERAVNYVVKDAAERAGINPAASIYWLRQAHASHAIDRVQLRTRQEL